MNKLEKVKQIISQTLNIPAEVVTEDLSIGQIDEWDSMGNMAIIAALEENLGIEFTMDDLFDLNSVKSIVEEIEKLS